MNVKSTSNYVVIDGYKFAKEELVCQSCGSTAISIDYRNEEQIEGVTALALGTKCRDCGDTALHISY